MKNEISEVAEVQKPKKLLMVRTVLPEHNQTGFAPETDNQAKLRSSGLDLREKDPQPVDRLD